MAATALSVVTTLISGAAITKCTTATGSSDTITITGPSSGPLDFNSLAIRIENTGSVASVVATIAVSSAYSALDLGTYAVTVSTGTTAIIGGTDFESARFLQVSAQSLVMTMTTADATSSSVYCSVEAYQAPYSHAG